MYYEGSKSKIKINGTISNSFTANTEGRQGNGLSLLLCNLKFESALRKINFANVEAYLGNKKFNDVFLARRILNLENSLLLFRHGFLSSQILSRNIKLRYTKPQFFQLFFMGVKRGLLF